MARVEALDTWEKTGAVDGTLHTPETEVEDELRFEDSVVSFTDTQLVLLVYGIETSFIISEETEVHGILEEGVPVEVEAFRAADGTLHTTNIEVEDTDD